MATVDMQQPSLLLGSDRTRLLRLLMTDKRTIGDSPVGDVRRYANGSTRLIKRAGRARGVELTVVVDLAGLEELRAFAGELVLYRDGLGTRMWCTFLPFEYEPFPDGQRFTVPLQLSELTFSEAV